MNVLVRHIKKKKRKNDLCGGCACVYDACIVVVALLRCCIVLYCVVRCVVLCCACVRMYVRVEGGNLLICKRCGSYCCGPHRWRRCGKRNIVTRCYGRICCVNGTLPVKSHRRIVG